MRNSKYPYVIRVLENQLLKEKGMLTTFESLTQADQQLSKELNIPSCEHRINELEEMITHVKTLTK